MDARGPVNQKQISDAAAVPATSRESVEIPNPPLERMGGRNADGGTGYLKLPTARSTVS